MTTYVAWITVNGEQWDVDSCETAAERDESAAEFAAQMRSEHPGADWRVWVGESTPTSAITPATSRLFAAR